MTANVAKLRYHGTGRSFLGLLIVNALLSIVTLGIYSFWARNKVREFHYSHTEMDGDRFAYHGTGGELLTGALKATGIILVLALLLVGATMLTRGMADAVLVQAGIMLGFYVLIGGLVILAVNGARRYRLSRSSWRGIRFSFHGKPGAFFAMMMKGILLSIVTLGFYSPRFQNQRRAFLVNNTKFGSEPFIYTGDGRELFGQWVKALLLTIPTLGLYWVWYAAFRHRYFWGHTTMRGGRFRSSVDGGELLGLQFVNAFLVIFTLGIGTPWAITRLHRYWCDNLHLHGTVDWASIQQQAQTAGGTGEALAEGMDVDVGIG